MEVIRNIIFTIIKPAELFNHCKEKNNWLPVLLIIIIICIFSSFLIVPSLISEQIERVKRDDSKSEQLKKENLAYLNSSYHHFSTYLSTIFTEVFYYPILAFFLTILPLVSGGKGTKYSYLFTGVLYIGILNSTGFLLDSVLKLKLNSMDIGLNLALFFNSSDLFINSLLKKINIFGLWQVVLLTIMISVYFNYNKIKSFLIIFNTWAVIKLISAYFTYLRLTIK